LTGRQYAVSLPEGGVPVYSWCEDLDENAAAQVVNLTRLPFVHHHVAVMPDAHFGYGMPIGGVLPARGVVIPNAVGVDIGCGMRAWNTNLHVDEFRSHGEAIMALIKERIPVGFAHRKERVDATLIEAIEEQAYEAAGQPRELPPIWDQERERAHRQLGTLGGGNHFIEAQVDEHDCLWFMIHSGSRNVGKQIADHYNKKAQGLNRRWFSTVPRAQELAFLPLGEQLAFDYLDDMDYALAFARGNRLYMEEVIREVLSMFAEDIGDEPWDIHHNYATIEHHYGQNVMLHRKGAVKAKGPGIIIPGSMGTKSYICEGLDSPCSFGSASHGAGRRMGRRAAAKDPEVRSTLENMTTMLLSDSGSWDEAPGAYKDIDDVMAHQADLVTITDTLTPLAVIKG